MVVIVIVLVVNGKIDRDFPASTRRLGRQLSGRRASRVHAGVTEDEANYFVVNVGDTRRTTTSCRESRGAIYATVKMQNDDQRG